MRRPLGFAAVGGLRGALRTEPNLGLVVLFGSAARGDYVAGISDVDLLVELRRPFPGALEALRMRLNRRLPGVGVQVVPIEGARRNPRLLAEVLRDGRPLIDREQSWSRLQARAARTQAQADRLDDGLRVGAQAAVGYFQRLAAARVKSPIGTGL